MEDFDFTKIVQLYSDMDPVMYQYFLNLLKNRTIILNSEIDESFLETVVLPLKQFEADGCQEKVTLILNTAGGSTADGLMICNVIDNYKKPLEIIVPSYSCSMGTIILCAGNKNPNVTKKCYPFSFALLHSGQTYVGGESTSVDDIVDFNRMIDNKIKEYIISNTNITPELYQQHHRKQWYLTSQELLEYHLVDEIIGK